MTLTRVDSLKGRDFLSLADLSPEEFAGVLESALQLKQRWKEGERPQALAHKTLAMIFEKQSLRTRSTFDIAMFQLGGHSVLLSQNYIGWGVRETIRDVAHNLERWTDGIMARTYGHATLLELTQHADVPVINGLSDLLHPCQLTADYLTLKEVFGELEGLKVTFVGDGNNVANSHVNAAALTGTHLTIACPEGFDPNEDVLSAAREKALTSRLLETRKRQPRARTCFTPTCGFRWGRKRTPSYAAKPLQATPLRPSGSGYSPSAASSCTTCPRTTAKSVRKTLSITSALEFSTRRKTACTRTRGYCFNCWGRRGCIRKRLNGLKDVRHISYRLRVESWRLKTLQPAPCNLQRNVLALPTKLRT